MPHLLCAIPSTSSHLLAPDLHHSAIMSAASKPPYPPHPTLQTDAPFGSSHINHGVLSVSSSTDRSREQHLWITDRKALPSFEINRRDDGFDTFHWTPFSSMQAWEQYRPHAPITEIVRYKIPSSSTASTNPSAVPISQHAPSQSSQSTKQSLPPPPPLHQTTTPLSDQETPAPAPTLAPVPPPNR